MIERLLVVCCCCVFLFGGLFYFFVCCRVFWCGVGSGRDALGFKCFFCIH